MRRALLAAAAVTFVGASDKAVRQQRGDRGGAAATEPPSDSASARGGLLRKEEEAAEPERVFEKSFFAEVGGHEAADRESGQDGRRGLVSAPGSLEQAAGGALGWQKWIPGSGFVSAAYTMVAGDDEEDKDKDERFVVTTEALELAHNVLEQANAVVYANFGVICLMFDFGEQTLRGDAELNEGLEDGYVFETVLDHEWCRKHWSSAWDNNMDKKSESRMRWPLDGAISLAKHPLCLKDQGRKPIVSMLVSREVEKIQVHVREETLCVYRVQIKLPATPPHKIQPLTFNLCSCKEQSEEAQNVAKWALAVTHAELFAKHKKECIKITWHVKAELGAFEEGEIPSDADWCRKNWRKAIEPTEYDFRKVANGVDVYKAASMGGTVSLFGSEIRVETAMGKNELSMIQVKDKDGSIHVTLSMKIGAETTNLCRCEAGDSVP